MKLSKLRVKAKEQAQAQKHPDLASAKASSSGFETLGTTSEPRYLYPDGARRPKKERQMSLFR